MKITRVSFFPIFAFWVFMMAALIAREYAAYSNCRREEGYGRLFTGDFPYRDEWMEIYSGERRIGYISYSVWDSPPDGYEISAQAVVRMPSFSGALRLESTSVIDSRFNLKELHARLVVPEFVDVSVNGRVEDDALQLEISSGGESLHMAMDPSRIVFTDLFTPLYAIDMGRVRGRRGVSVYDPLTGAEEELAVEARGRRTIHIADRRVDCREFTIKFRMVTCSVFLDKEEKLLLIKGPEDFMVVNEMLLGKGAGKELASLAVQE
ncbi:MAG: hypothetical protein P9M00_05150 [Candidatus Tritonobacter lacicola]|nr:hypothetical protein [Candidatus Tritonobacter lacicola]